MAADARRSSTSSLSEQPMICSSSSAAASAATGAAAVSLVPPSQRHRRPRGRSRILRLFRSLCRSLPVFTPPRCKLIPVAPCRLPSSAGDQPDHRHHLAGGHLDHRRVHGHRRLTGTLFGLRRGRISLALQEAPRCLPSLVLELALPTQVLLRELGSGMVRIALECEKRPHPDRAVLPLLQEPLWTMFCNGKKNGYGVRREASEEDLAVMETLRPVSMGAGVLPGRSEAEGAEGEMAYMRAYFEQVVGSRDSETFYMMGPDGTNGPELTIFFIRI